MARDVIKEFLVSIGFATDDASVRRTEGQIKRVEEIARRSDRARTQSASQQSMERARQALRAEGVENASMARIMGRRREMDAAEAASAKKRDEHERRQAQHRAQAANGLRTLSTVAVATAAAVQAATVALAGYATQVAAKLEVMAYASERTRSSVAELRTFSQAVSQLGGSAGGALNAAENLAERLRRNPQGYSSFLKSVGVEARDAQGNLKGAVQLLREFRSAVGKSKSYEQQLLYADEIGTDESTWRAMDPAKLAAREAEIKARYSRMGFDPDAAKEDAKGLQNSLRDLFDTLSVIGEKTVSRIFKDVGDNLKGLTTFLEQHGDQIAEILSKIAQAVLAVSRAFLELATSDTVKGLLDGLLGSFGKVDDATGKWVADTEKIKGALEALATFVATIFVAKITRAFSDVLKEAAPLLGLLKFLGFGGTAVVGASIGTAIGADGAVPGGMKPGASNYWDDEASGAAGGAGQGGVISRLWQKGKAALGFGSGTAGRAIRPTSGNIHPEVEAYIRQAAKARGINPDTAVGIADGEGLGGSTPTRLTPGDVRNGVATSFGAFQLHRGGAGSVGTEFERRTGKKVDDPTYWKEQIDFALDWAKKNGWSAWYGRSKHGIGEREGLDYAAPGSGGAVDQRQSGIRNQAITQALHGQIAAAAAAAGVNAEVYSGGQDATGPNRTGSHRHDHGQSADLKLYTVGADGKRRYLSMDNETDRTTMEKFIRESVKAGANGVGAGPGYMGPSGIHIGGGSPAAWGAGGSSANAPDWVRRAHQDGMAARSADAYGRLTENAQRLSERFGNAVDSIDKGGLRAFGAATQGFNPGAFFSVPPLGASSANTTSSTKNQTFNGGTTNVTINSSGDAQATADIWKRQNERQKADDMRNAASIFA